MDDSTLDHATAANRVGGVCSACFQNGNLYRRSVNAQHQQPNQQQHGSSLLSCGHEVTVDTTAILPMISQFEFEPYAMVNGNAFRNQTSGLLSNGNYSETGSYPPLYQSRHDPGSASFPNMWIDSSISPARVYMGAAQTNMQTLAVDTSTVGSQTFAPISDYSQTRPPMPIVHPPLQPALGFVEHSSAMSQGSQYTGQQQQFEIQPPIPDFGPFQQLNPVLEPAYGSHTIRLHHSSSALVASMQTISFDSPVEPAAASFPVTPAAFSPLFPFSCDEMDITSASFMASNTAHQPFAINSSVAMAASEGSIAGINMPTNANASPLFSTVRNVAQAMPNYENQSSISFSSGAPLVIFPHVGTSNSYVPISQPFSVPVSRASSEWQFDETMVARRHLNQGTAIVQQAARSTIETSLPLCDILSLASNATATQEDVLAPVSMSAPAMPESKRPTILRRSHSKRAATTDTLPPVTSLISPQAISSPISGASGMNRGRHMSQPTVPPWSTVGTVSTASTASFSSPSSSSHSVLSPIKGSSKSLRPLSTQFTFVTSTPQANKKMFLGKSKISGRRSSTSASQFQLQSTPMSKSLLLDTSKATTSTPRRITDSPSSLDKVFSASLATFPIMPLPRARTIPTLTSTSSSSSASSAVLPVSSSSSPGSSQPFFITFDMNKVDTSSAIPPHQHHQQQRLTQYPISSTSFSTPLSPPPMSDTLSFTSPPFSSSSELAAVQRLPPKKPCNSYMIYRMQTFAKNRAYFQRGRCSGSTISKEIARFWNQEPEHVKRQFEIEAEMERFRLKQTFPGYRYQRKSSNNKSGSKKKKH